MASPSLPIDAPYLTSSRVVGPALPPAWPSGSVYGLCARGGYQVNMEWRDGCLLSAAIRSQRSGSIPVRYGDRVLNLRVEAGRTVKLQRKSFVS